MPLIIIFILFVLANSQAISAECSSLLLSSNSILFSLKSIFAASGIGNIEAVKQHLASGVDVNTKDSQSGTPLHYASDQIKVAEFLLEKDARVNSVDYRGRTPLDYAMSVNDSEVADLLRKHGGKTKKELEAAGN